MAQMDSGSGSDHPSMPDLADSSSDDEDQRQQPGPAGVGSEGPASEGAASSSGDSDDDDEPAVEEEQILVCRECPDTSDEVAQCVCVCCCDVCAGFPMVIVVYV